MYPNIQVRTVVCPHCQHSINYLERDHDETHSEPYINRLHARIHQQAQENDALRKAYDSLRTLLDFHPQEDYDNLLRALAEIACFPRDKAKGIAQAVLAKYTKPYGPTRS